MGTVLKLLQRRDNSKRNRYSRHAVVLTCMGLGVGVYLTVVPATAARESLGRLAPILVFLAGISSVVNLAAKAGVFEQIALTTTRRVRNRPLPLWLLIAVLAAVSTAFLSLDTTVVLLTPMVVALTRIAGVGVMPLALTVVWIANVGSLWLPASNLTNLLAVQSGVLTDTNDFLDAAFQPAIVALLTVTAFAYALFHRHLRGQRLRITPKHIEAGDGVSATNDGQAKGRRCPAVPRAGPESAVVPKHPAYRACAFTLLLLLPMLVTPVPYWASTTVAATFLTAVFLRRDRTVLQTGLVPWSAMALVTSLVLSLQIAHQLGAENIVRKLLGQNDVTGWGLAALAAAGAGMSNLINNLPAYLLLEPAANTSAALVALLIGTNAGPLITPWASLATVLWAEQLRRHGVRVPWCRFALIGIVLTPLTVGIPILALILSTRAIG